MGVSNCNNRASDFLYSPSKITSDVPEALKRNCELLRESDRISERIQCRHASFTGRFSAPLRSTFLNRFTSNHRVRMFFLRMQFRPDCAKPHHLLARCIYIWGRYINARPDNLMNRARKALGKASSFWTRKGLRIDYKPPLSPTKWNIHDRSLPGHPHCKCFYLLKCYL